MSPLPAAATELFHYLMPRSQATTSASTTSKSFKGKGSLQNKNVRYDKSLTLNNIILNHRITSQIFLHFIAPSMQDEQREKQLSPIEYLSDTCQLLKRSMYTQKSSTSDASDKEASRTIRSSSIIPPSPYKVDPFVNHIAPFSTWDKIKVLIVE